MREADIENYLVEQVKLLGGETRKVAWIGRTAAPDRVVFLPQRPAVWFEVKSPTTVERFPSNPHERAQWREHERMRLLGQPVFVVGTTLGVDLALSVAWSIATLPRLL